MEKDQEKNGGGKRNDENCSNYVFVSSHPPERQPLERRTLVPIRKIDTSESFDMKIKCTYFVPSLQ